MSPTDRIGAAGWRLVLLASLGGALEFYDFVIFGIFAKDIADAVREARIYTSQTFNYSSLIAAAILFLVASVPMARFADWATRRDQERRLQRTM